VAKKFKYTHGKAMCDYNHFKRIEVTCRFCHYSGKERPPGEYSVLEVGEGLQRTRAEVVLIPQDMVMCGAARACR
jgi:hypothetical protein